MKKYFLLAIENNDVSAIGVLADYYLLIEN
jgi:hypothetical protein